MAEREVDNRLEELRNAGKKTYSISRLNAINQCKYQSYLNYFKFEKQKDSIYGLAGNAAHDLIEKCIKGLAKKEDIKPCITTELDDLEMIGVCFPTDRNGGDTIRDNYVKNMTKFSEEFEIPQGEFKTEELLILPIDDTNYMIGYADAIRYNDDGTVSLIDWKTSSQFDKGHLIQAGRQLILYKLALEHLGLTVRDCMWCMLKYCETSWTLKNGKTKTKVSEWRNMIKDMSTQIEKALSELGIDEIDIEIYMRDALEKNSWEVFPKEIRDKYKTTVYYRQYDITQELIDETLEYIKNSINMYEELSENNATPCNIQEQSYYCANLCGYGGKSGKCQYWVDYCSTFDKSDDDDDLF